jgi:hypothetical protein
MFFFQPEQLYFCHTICGRARTYLAMSVDTHGFKNYYQELYKELGMTMLSVTGSTTTSMVRRGNTTKFMGTPMKGR